MDINKEAKEYVQRIIDKNPAAEAWDFESAFIAGAKLQKKEDKRRFSEWLQDNQYVEYYLDDGWLNNRYMEHFFRFIDSL